MPRTKRLSSRVTKSAGPTVLIVDDNTDLLHFLTRLMADEGWSIVTAESAAEGKRLALAQKPTVALIDYMLPDGNGVELGVEFLESVPGIHVIVMTGTSLPAEEEALCEERLFPILRKPFLASDVIGRIRSSLEGPRSAEATKDSRALKVFFSYSHKDEKLRDRLDAHLSSLKHMGIIHSWHDRKITAGSHVDNRIDAQLEKADLILLLVSADFFSSEYCYKKEMRQALERHKAGKARVIPVILRPVDWDQSPFAGLMAVPTDGKPITRWTNRDAGYLSAAREIRRVAEELSATVKSRR
jgi:DNA-binding response OmpR family regulator